MKESKTIQTIQNYYYLVNQNFNNLNNDDKFFCGNIEFDLVKRIFQEFGDTSARKIAKKLLGACNS